MNDIPSGEQPAFPCSYMDFSPDNPGVPIPREQFFGLSIRAYFAIKILPSIYQDLGDLTKQAAADRLGIPVDEYKTKTHRPMLCAKEARRFADALIAELNLPKTT